MTWLVNNWSLLVVLLCGIVASVIYIRKFLQQPTEEQIKSIKAWLLYAVFEAEKDLGVGTGKLKLRKVYDMFIKQFPWAVKIVTFSQFSMWVDEVLEDMKSILSSNPQIKQYITGTGW